MELSGTISLGGQVMAKAWPPSVASLLLELASFIAPAARSRLRAPMIPGGASSFHLMFACCLRCFVAGAAQHLCILSLFSLCLCCGVVLFRSL